MLHRRQKMLEGGRESSENNTKAVCVGQRSAVGATGLSSGHQLDVVIIAHASVSQLTARFLLTFFKGEANLELKKLWGRSRHQHPGCATASMNCSCVAKGP